MITQTTRISIDVLRRIKALTDAGRHPRDIAQTLDEEGISVPRDASDDPVNAARRAAKAGKTPRTGYNLATNPDNPGRWTRKAVEQVIASPEYDRRTTWSRT